MNIIWKKTLSAVKYIKPKTFTPTFLSCSSFATTYNSQGLLRIHGRIRYDENAYLKDDTDAQEVLIVLRIM